MNRSDLLLRLGPPPGQWLTWGFAHNLGQIQVIPMGSLEGKEGEMDTQLGSWKLLVILLPVPLMLGVSEAETPLPATAPGGPGGQVSTRDSSTAPWVSSLHSELCLGVLGFDL